MKFEHTEVFNFEGAFRGLRNPLESWNKSDSDFKHGNETNFRYDDFLNNNDLNLAQKMIRGGTEQSKFLRQIFVSVDIKAPLYWWKEFDTYKVGTVANSTSTMHKLAQTKISLDCFELNSYSKNDKYFINIINHLEDLRQKYLKNENPKIWLSLVQQLPESWLQTRTITMNYEVIRNIIRQRSHHKLNEWSYDFMTWCIAELPYAKDLLFYDD